MQEVGIGSLATGDDEGGPAVSVSSSGGARRRHPNSTSKLVERENPEHFRFHFRASPVILAIGSNYSQGARVKGTTDLLLI
jgi:hypothetical protein